MRIEAVCLKIWVVDTIVVIIPGPRAMRGIVMGGGVATVTVVRGRGEG